MCDSKIDMEQTVAPVVMTLDAGGTNFVFSAMQAGEQIVKPVTLPSCSHALDACLQSLCNGFEHIKAALQAKGMSPVAISFAFPGPADYPAGVIGDLPNFPGFRGGVPLKAILEKHFGAPVYINNDGKLFAFGEAHCGVLNKINTLLEGRGSAKRYRNLIGITLGTGFGGGVVVDGHLLQGDNGCGGDVWCLPNPTLDACIAEESVSIRAVKRVYRELSGDGRDLEPKDIFNIAKGLAQGNRQAAVAAFHQLGTVVGEILATALTLIDGVVVIGGGLAGAYEFIVPAIKKVFEGKLTVIGGERYFPRLQMRVYDASVPEELDAFLHDETEYALLPGSETHVPYSKVKKTLIAVSELGASHAVSCGAYIYALKQMKK